MKKGFSLIELVIALAISSGIAVTLFQIYNQTTRLLTHVDSMVSADLNVVTFYNRFEKDVTGAFVPVIGDLDLARKVLEKHEGVLRTQSVAPVAGQGEKGKQPQPEKVKPVTLGDIQVKKLFVYESTKNNLSLFSFITCNPLEVYKQLKPRIARVSYSLQKDDKGRFNLLRRESDKLGLKYAKAGRPYILLRNIRSLKLVFLATEPEKKKAEKTEEDNKKVQPGQKAAPIEEKNKEEEKKPKPLKEYDSWPIKEEDKEPMRDLPEFVKISLVYYDSFEDRDQKYEFMMPVFNYKGPSEDILKAPLMVQERIKKDEDETTQKVEKKKTEQKEKQKK